MNRAVLQSGKPGRSASRKLSDHWLVPFFKREPNTATSSALRSPLPRYHDVSRSPLGHSTMPGAWLCLSWSGKINSAEYWGASAEKSSRQSHVVTEVSSNEVYLVASTAARRRARSI